MLMRVFLLLIGLFAVGEVKALAANSPPVVDPREDLFAAKPESVASAAPLTVAPAANPLWAIPLSQLTETRERPVFAPTRRPPPVAVAAKPAPVPVPPPKPPEPEKPQLSLVGTVTGDDSGGIGVFIEAASKTALRLKAGESYKGWVLHAVRRRQVELAKGPENTVLDFPPPEMKAGPAPALPAPPAMPVAAALGSPATPASPPTNAALGVPASAPARAAISFQKPVFTPPPLPPEPVNPFQNAFQNLQFNPLQRKARP